MDAGDRQRAGEPSYSSPADDGARYRRLDADRIIGTAERLCDRIGERLGARGLLAVAQEVRRAAARVKQEVLELDDASVPIRIGVALLVILLVAGIVVSLRAVNLPSGIADLGELVTTIESAVNDAVFVGIAVYFLITVEQRWKRRRALVGLHQLRSLVHVIDMHQLTKDPDRVGGARSDTASSPREDLDADELRRYLDYCSELLSVVGKIAALYAQHLDDPVVLGSVTEVESLATGMSGKIWQKLTILDASSRRG